MTMTIQQAIDRIISSVPGAPFSDTVDTVKAGDPSQEITGVLVSFLATCEVIDQAVQLGANLIITHEPTFYNHLDTTDWLSQHPSYVAKRRLIDESGVVIWRFHDYLHSLPPDSTFMGLLKELTWDANGSPEQPYICSIHPVTLLELGQWVKNQLGLQTIRVAGDLTHSVSGLRYYRDFRRQSFKWAAWARLARMCLLPEKYTNGKSANMCAMPPIWDTKKV